MIPAIDVEEDGSSLETVKHCTTKTIPIAVDVRDKLEAVQPVKLPLFSAVTNDSGGAVDPLAWLPVVGCLVLVERRRRYHRTTGECSELVTVMFLQYCKSLLNRMCWV